MKTPISYFTQKRQLGGGASQSATDIRAHDWAIGRPAIKRG